TWYLKSMNYITREDNSDFALTAVGVDYVESNHVTIPMLNKLLNSGSRTATSSPGPMTNRVTEERLLLGPVQPAKETAEDPKHNAPPDAGPVRTNGCVRSF